MAHLRKRGKKFYAWFYRDGKQTCVNLNTHDYREALRLKRELEAAIVLEKKPKPALEVELSRVKTRNVALQAEVMSRMERDAERKQEQEQERKRASNITFVNGIGVDRMDAVAQLESLPKDHLLDDLWVMYCAWAETNRRDNTRAIQGFAWTKLLEFTGAKRIGDLTPDLLEQFKFKCLQKKLSPCTANIYLKSLQGVFKFAIENGLYSGKNPIAQVKMFRIEKNAPQFLSREQIVNVLAISKEKDISTHLVFVLGIHAGLRKNEIANARWEWFDFERGVINVRSHTGFQLKDYESRCIPLSQALKQHLEPHRKASGFVFESRSTNKGKNRYRFEPKRSFHTVVEEAGVPWCTIQTLRETFASQLVSQGVSIYKVSRWLGHADVKTTQEHYAHLASENDSDIDKVSFDVAAKSA